MTADLSKLVELADAPADIRMSRLADVAGSELATLERLLLVDRARRFTVGGFCAYMRVVYGLELARHHIEWVTSILEAMAEAEASGGEEPARVLIEAPPESAKTTVAVGLVGWYIGLRPDRTNLFISVSDDQAQKRAIAVAATIERAPGYRQIFPDIVPDRERSWGVESGYWVRDVSDAEWDEKTVGQIDPTLTAGGYTNRSIIGKRVTGIMPVDDILDETNTESSDMLDTVSGIYFMTLSSRPTRGALMLTIGTPWKKNDVYEKIEKSDLYRVHITPALNPETGESYWPEQWSENRLAKKEIEVELARIGSFALMYLMDRKAGAGGVLKLEWLVDFPHQEIKTEWTCVYGVDFAAQSATLLHLPKKKRTPDFFSISKGRIAPWGIVQWDVIAEIVGAPDARETLVRHAGYDTPVGIGLETDGSGDQFYQDLIIETRLPIIPMKTGGAPKATRLEKIMAPKFKSLRVRISDEQTPGLQLFRKLWLAYPTGKLDPLDACYYMLKVRPGAVQEYGELDGEAGLRPRVEHPLNILGQLRPARAFHHG